MVKYEAMLLIDSEVDEEGIDKIKHQFEELITGGNGNLGSWEVWGRKRLASKIKGKTEATYVLVTFDGDEKILSELRRVSGLSEKILRCLILRKNGK